MKSFDSGTHSFVFRFWPEPWDEQEPQLLWRGHVTHVPGGERLFVQNLGDALNFMAQFLQGTGVDFEGTKFHLSPNTVSLNPINNNPQNIASSQRKPKGEHLMSEIVMNEVTWNFNLATGICIKSLNFSGSRISNNSGASSPEPEPGLPSVK